MLPGCPLYDRVGRIAHRPVLIAAAVIAGVVLPTCSSPPPPEAPGPEQAEATPVPAPESIREYRASDTPIYGPELARQVVVRRTAYGVPHIRGENLQAAAFGLAYVQMEDYGQEVVRRILRAKGVWGRLMGRDSMAADFGGRQRHARAIETYHLLEADTRAVLSGFAAGLNHFIRVRGDELDEKRALHGQPEMFAFLVDH